MNDGDDEIHENHAGRALAEALGLQPSDIESITIEPAGSDSLVVTVTHQRWLVAPLIAYITQHRLVPITDLDTRPLEDDA